LGLRPRDDNTLSHCEEQRDAAIHRVSKDADEGMRFAYRFTVDRHGLRPRDDKRGESAGR